MRRLALTAAALAMMSSAASADELDTLRAQLNSAKQAIQLLEQRVQALEAEKARAAAAGSGAAASTAAPAPPAAAANTAAPATAAAANTAAAAVNSAENKGIKGAPVVAPDLAASDSPPTDPDRARLEIYGFAQIDGIYDFDRVNPSWNATLRPSTIPVNCPGDAGCGKDGETIGSVRQSRLGARGYLPTDWGTLMSRFEFDLFGVGSDAGKTTMRIRHVYGELGPVLAGQTNSLFMDGDVFPNVLDYWGPSGMIFVRNPQLRWTPWSKNGTHFAVAFEAQSAAIDAGNAAGVDPSLSGVTGHSRYPDVTAQIKSEQSWGHVQLAGVGRWLGFETPANQGANPSGHVWGYGVNATGSLKTWGKDKILAQVAYGQGIAGYINDCCVDVAPNSNLRAEAVPLLGWLAYYNHYWSEKWSSALGYSEARQNNTGGQLGDAFATGRYASGNLLWYPVRNMTTGVELLWGQRENKDGTSADDTRVQFSAKYEF